jgi:hypothetical protein
VKLPYSQRSEREKEQLRSGARRQHARKRAWLAEFRSKRGCSHCGETDPIVLDFHHIDPSTKETTKFNNLGWERMMAEVEKCIVLCANCHRREEYSLRRGY